VKRATLILLASVFLAAGSTFIALRAGAGVKSPQCLTYDPPCALVTAISDSPFPDSPLLLVPADVTPGVDTADIIDKAYEATIGAKSQQIELGILPARFNPSRTGPVLVSHVHVEGTCLHSSAPIGFQAGPCIHGVKDIIYNALTGAWMEGGGYAQA